MWKINKPIYSCINNTLLTALLLALLASCTDNADIPGSDPGETGLGDVYLTLTVAAPGSRVTRQGAKIQTRSEDIISSIQVLVFEDGIYKYRVAGENLTGNSALTTFNASLHATTSQVRLYLIANSNHYFESQELPVGSDESSIKRILVTSITDSGITGALPMFGTYDRPEGLRKGSNPSTGQILMLRSVAAVDVSLAGTVTNFRLASIQAFRVSDKMQIVPNNWGESGDPKVDAPSIPGSTNKVINTAQLSVNNEASSLTLYLPEIETANENDDITKSTCIVVGGYYNGENNITYYRANFDPGQTNGHILRNHRYAFAVTKVSKTGEATAEEAANSNKTGITAVVTNWEENENSMIFEGENYFSVSSRKINLPFRAGKAATIDVITNLTDYKLQWADDAGLPASAASGTIIEDEEFRAEVIEGGSKISVTALQSGTTENKKRNMLILAGPWEILISIEQSGNKGNAGLYVNILTLGGRTGIGSFGGTFPGRIHAGNASGIVPFLQNPDNFGPNGIVPLGFIAFDYNSGGSDMNAFRAYLQQFDMVHLCWATTSLSEDEAREILNWLQEKQNRVLMITRDNDSRCENILKEIYGDIAPRDVWNGSGATTGDIQFVGYNEKNGYFTKSGPFGQVNPEPESFYIRLADTTWRGMDPNSPAVADIVPLGVHGTQGHYLWAVDVNRRIIYWGDSSMFQGRTNGFNTTGAVDHDRQRLLGNVFAWAIEEIILPGK